MNRLLLAFFIITSLQAFGQSKTLRGKIMADSLQGYAINIVNFTKEIGTTNDENGFFNIPAAVGDSIVFSSVQYQIQSIIVTSEHLQKGKVAIVLFPVIQQLEQVKISNIQLSGDLNKDAGIVELMPFVDNRTLGLPFSDKPQPTQAQRRLYTAKTSASGVPLDLLLNIMSGRLKKLKRIEELEGLKSIVRRGETTFNTSFFVDSLGIHQDLISDFVYYCAEDTSFEALLDHQKRLTLLEFFQKKSKSYHAYKEKE